MIVVKLYGQHEKHRLIELETSSQNGKFPSTVPSLSRLTTASAKAQKPVVILPDKDADGLSSGAILHHTLTSLGL